MKKQAYSLLYGLVGGIIGTIIVLSLKNGWINSDRAATLSTRVPQHTLASFTSSKSSYPTRIDLSIAADRSRSSVVFIRNIHEGIYQDPFAWFFGGSRSKETSTGSGVIFSEDGYIVTNHHVIEKADRIEVVHQKRTYRAERIGSDPSTDIAVIKVKGVDLPAIELGSSADLRIGDWVLAVGNPFNLSSTVTAGIVSAKGRNINILKDKFPIESFIQTDAAINPGNSGGALVNEEGLLVGINTAILSRTGSYAGYSFAVPVDIVRKVVNDLIQYQEVQRAFAGMEFVDIDSELATRIELTDLNGILIHNIQSTGAAEEAGLRVGDVIIAVNDQKISSKSEMEELIGLSYPGDVLDIHVLRSSDSLNIELKLLNKEGTTSIIERKTYVLDKWGVELEEIARVEQNLYQINHGVKITSAHSKFFLGFPKNFIITHINKKPVHTPNDVERLLNSTRGRVLFQGITQDGRRLSMWGNIF